MQSMYLDRTFSFTFAEPFRWVKTSV